MTFKSDDQNLEENILPVLEKALEKYFSSLPTEEQSSFEEWLDNNIAAENLLEKIQEDFPMFYEILESEIKQAIL